jgi:hypothetical protein
MPNYKLQIGKIIIPLPTNFEATLRIQNPYMSIELVGDYSFQFQIPKDDISRQVFGDVELPNVGIVAQQSYACILLADNYIVFEGFCNLRKGSNFTYSIDLSKTPGNIQKSVFEQQLSYLDLGKYEIPTTPVTTGIWFIDKTQLADATTDAFFKDDFLEYNSLIIIYIDGIEQLRASYTGGRNNDPAITITQNWEANRNSFNNVKYPNIQLLDTDIGLNFVFADTAIHNVKAVISRYEPLPARQTGPRTITHNYTAKQVSYDSIGNFPDQTLTALWTEPFFYPYIENDTAYDSSTYTGIVNKNNGSTYELNTYANRDAFGLTPAFSLKWLFEKVCTYLGYTVVSDIFTDEDIKAVHIVGSRGQDKQCPTTKLPFNIYDNIIQYNLYMPDWTIKEFLESFKILTGTGLDFRPAESKVYIKLLNDVISEKQKNDVSNRLGFLTTNNVLYKKTYQLKFSESSDNLRYKPYPLDETLKKNNVENIQSIDMKMIPALMAVDNLLPTDTEYAQVALAKANVLSMNTKMRSPLYLQDNESLQHRIFYKKTNALGEISINNNGKNLDLRIDGHKGLYEKRLKVFLDFLNSIEEYETIIALNPYELTALELDKPIHGYHIDLFIWQIEVKLPLKETSVIRLWRR